MTLKHAVKSVRASGLAMMVALGTTAFVTPVQAQVQLDFWDMIWGPPEYIDAAQAIVNRFNDEHPDIEVTYRSVPWANWYQTFVTAVSAGSAPDVSTGAGYQAVQLYDMGAIRAIDDLIEELRAEGDLDDFIDGTVDTLRYDDHYVALPWGLDIRVWYYRQSLLDGAGVSVPTSFEEMREAAAAVTEGDVYGVVASGDTGGTHYAYSAILNNGGGLFNAERELELDSERNVEALEWLAAMVADGSVHPASPGYSSDDKRAAFFQGQAAFALDNPGLDGAAGPEIAADIGIVPPLEGFHGDQGTIFWVNNIMMYEQTQHPEEAKTFLKWWSQNQLPLWTEGNTTQMPARSSFVEEAVGDRENYRYIVENYLPVGKTTGYAAEGIFPQLSEIEGEGVMQTLIQQLWQGRPLTDILSQADARLQEIMR
jgi:multiple sugar transport system substrate-binding protein